MPKVAVLYDQGSVVDVEDGHVLNSPFATVIDGVSAPWSQDHPPRRFSGLMGGEMAAREVERVFSAAHANCSLRELMLEANEHVAAFQAEAGIDLTAAPELLAGCAIVAARWEDEAVEIVQAADCRAVWQLRNGEVGVTPSQMHAHEAILLQEIERLMCEIARERGVVLEGADDETRRQIRDEMRRRYYPFYVAARRRNMNNPTSSLGYGFLNGQPAFAQMWRRQVLPRQQLARLLLISDGLVPWELAKEGEEDAIVRAVLDSYRQGGLCGVLAAARRLEASTNAVSYVDFAEATGIAIEF